MSVLCCDECGRFIDTDDEPEAYDPIADKWWCELCFPDYKSDEPMSVQRYQNWSQGR